MKIEKLAENKIKVTLTTYELDVWDINPKSISPDSPQLREFIASLVNQCAPSSDMGSNILVEARPAGDDFVFIITRVSAAFEDMSHEISKALKKQKLINGQYRLLPSAKKAASQNEYFSFETLEDFADMLKSSGPGIFEFSRLYKTDTAFCLEVEKSSPNFEKCSTYLCEYASRLSGNSLSAYMSEHASLFASHKDFEIIMNCY